MIYSFPYVLLFLFYVYLYFSCKKKIKKNSFISEKKIRRKYYFIACVVYLFFYGLRGFIFTDWISYYNYFYEIGSGDFQEMNLLEPGYVYSNLIVYKIFPDYFVFQFVWTAIDVFLLYKIFKRETGKYFLLAFALLIAFFDGIQINLMRNIKSILIFFYAIEYIRQNNFKKYLICILVAMFFHVTSIIYIPIYFFIKSKRKNILIIFSIVSIFISLIGFGKIEGILTLLGALLGGKFNVIDTYLSTGVNPGITLGFLYRTFLLIIILWKYDSLSKQNCINTNLAVLYLSLNLFFNSVLTLRDRIPSLFILGFIIIFPYILSTIKNKTYKYIFLFINVVCIVGFVYNPHKTIIAKYENVLFKSQDADKAEQRIFDNLEERE